MNYRTVALMVADMAIFFETTNEEHMDLDTSVDGVDILMYHLKKLDESELFKLCDAIREVSKEYEGDARAFVKSIPEDFGLVDEPEDDSERDD